MANEQNLEKSRLDKINKEDARKIARLGGIKSGEVKRERKTFKEALLALLKEGNLQEDINAALILQAKQGNVKAFEVLRDTVGEKPTDKSEVKVDGEPFKIVVVKDKWNLRKLKIL